MDISDEEAFRAEMLFHINQSWKLIVLHIEGDILVGNFQ